MMDITEVVRLRDRGLSVFPVSNDTKVPIVKWGRLQVELPTYDEVTEWFTPNNRSVGVATGKLSGILMLDFDFTKYPKAREFYELHDFPYTWKETTKSDGMHMYFRWTDELDTIQTNTTGELWEGIDTKGEGGYAKIAPSEGYSWVVSPNMAALAFPPQWLIDELRRVEKKRSSPVGWISDSLSNLKPGNFHNESIRIIGKFHHSGWTAQEIFDMMLPHIEKAGGSVESLKARILSIGQYPSDAQRQSTEPDTLEGLLALTESFEYLVPNVFVKESIIFLAGLPGSQKTWAALDLAIELSREREGLWMDRFPVKRCRVVYVEQERNRLETKRRALAMLKEKNLTIRDLPGLIKFKTGTTIRLNVHNSLEAFDRLLTETKPDIVIVDSFKTFHTMDICNNQSMQEVMEIVKALRMKHRCAFLFVYHENNMAYGREREKREVTLENMAGAAVLKEVPETVFILAKRDMYSAWMHHVKNNAGGDLIAPVIVSVENVTPDKSQIKVVAR